MSETEIPRTIAVQSLTEEAFEPYGWMLGRAYPRDVHPSAFSNPATDFWAQHVFRTHESSVAGGGSEILWVNYRNTEMSVGQVEKHLLTEQAIVPLTGSIVQLMACSDEDGHVDLRTAKAFIIEPGQGICMRPHAWHATRSLATEVTCLMLTRASTTQDLVAHLREGAPASESVVADVERIDLVI